MSSGKFTSVHPRASPQTYLCFIEFPRSLRGICGDQRGTERVSAEEKEEVVMFCLDKVYW